MVVQPPPLVTMRLIPDVDLEVRRAGRAPVEDVPDSTSCKASRRSALICRRCTEGSRHASSCSWRSLAAKLDTVGDAMLSHNTSL